MKLSKRAWEILLVIDERSGSHGTFWVPGEMRGHSDFCNRLYEFVNINGPGDARILKSLEAKGLTQHKSVMKYAYRITEEGRNLIESSIKDGSIPLTIHK